MLHPLYIAVVVLGLASVLIVLDWLDRSDRSVQKYTPRAAANLSDIAHRIHKRLGEGNDTYLLPVASDIQTLWLDGHVVCSQPPATGSSTLIQIRPVKDKLARGNPRSRFKRGTVRVHYPGGEDSWDFWHKGAFIREFQGQVADYVGRPGNKGVVVLILHYYENPPWGTSRSECWSSLVPHIREAYFITPRAIVLSQLPEEFLQHSGGAPIHRG